MVILAQGADLTQLGIQVGLRTADVADDLAQFGDAILLAGVFQPLDVDHETAGREPDQYAGGPFAEKGRLRGADPVADRDHHIEAVESDRFCGPSNLHKLQIALLRQFAFFKDVGDVTRNHGNIASEQLRHLRLRHPQGIAFMAQFSAHTGIVGIDQETIASVFTLDQADRLLRIGHGNVLV